MRHIPFEEMPWQSDLTGHRFKAVQHNGRQLRILELTPEFEEVDWCLRGHIGMVLEGVLELEFEDKTQTYRPGDGYILPAGQDNRHKAKALTPIVRVVMVEDAL